MSYFFMLFTYLKIRNLGFYLSRVHLDACSTWTWSPIFFLLQICEQHKKNVTFLFTSWSLTLTIKNLGFYLSKVHLDACSTWTWSQIIFFSFLFYKVISNSSRKKFSFFTYLESTWSLQHLNLKAYTKNSKICGYYTIKINLNLF